MISELVDRLRTEAKSMGTYGMDYMATLLMRSADAIEMLSEKAREPEQGEWTIKNGELAFWDVCSVCGKMVMHKAPFYNYCPNCGSKMKGVDRESLL